jgi:ubiquinone biosynthesis protein
MSPHVFPSIRRMKITAIPQFYRNVRRGTEIVSILSKYGLADWLSSLNIEYFKDQLKNPAGEALARLTRETRIRLALTELGPTFIKLGQLMSTRPDVVGVALADELKQLQTDVPADPPATARSIVEAELGEPIEEIFSQFSDEPIASASIGQVHRARLRTGQYVVVKVQHEGIEPKVNEDLEVLAALAQLAERIPEFAPYRPTGTVAEMARTVRRELDFGREERNLHQFATLFKDNPTLRIPQPFTEYCTPRVLTMDYLDGKKLSQVEQLRAAGYDVEQIARRGAEVYMEMIFTHGFFHADPHPGNILLLPGNVIGLLDFGMVGRLDERMREDIEELLMAIVNEDVGLLTAVIVQMGAAPPDLDERALARDLADFVGQFAGQPLDQFDLSGCLNDMIEIIRRHQIHLPPPVALLIKTLVTLEGTSKMLNPQFSVLEVLQPYHKKMIMRRLSPGRQWRKLRRVAYEVEQLIEVLPRLTIDLLEQIRTGKFDVHLEHRGLEPSVNRLVFGMITSALFLGSSLMLAQAVPPLLFPENSFLGLYRISILGLSGLIVSVLLGLRLLWAIKQSGHLDRRE